MKKTVDQGPTGQDVIGASPPATTGRDLRPAAALAALAALVYLATLSRNFSGDAVRYAIKAETPGLLAGMDLYHLFNHPLAWLAWQAGRLSGWQERALVPVQVPNALAGGAAVGLLFLLARGLGLSTRAATVAAAGLGASCAMWLLATDGEYVTPGLALALLPLVLLYRADDVRLARPAFALMLGASLALAGLAFQTNLLLIPVLLWALALRSDLPAGQRRRVAGLMVTAVAVLYATGYGLALATLIGPPGLQAWRLHPGMGLGYGLPEWRSIPHGAYALVRSLVGFPGLSLSDSTNALWAAADSAWRAGFVAWYAVAALIFTAPLVFGLRALRGARARHEGTERTGLVGAQSARAWQPLLLWALLSAAFAVYWVPGDLSFWAVVVIPWWLLVAGLVGNRPMGMVLVALVALVNAGALVLPNHNGARNAAYLEALALTETMAAGDLLMVPVEGRLQVYAYYLTSGAVFVPGAGSGEMPVEKRMRQSIDRALEQVGRRQGRLLVYNSWSGAWNQVPTSEERRALPAEAWWGYRLEQVGTTATGTVDALTR